jgi:nitroreductase
VHDRAPASVEARAIVRRRRSAVDMDARTALSSGAFYGMLRTLVPHLTPALHPWPGPACVHPVFFVHRVTGLAPGLAILVRDPAAEPELRAAISLDRAFPRLPGQPEDLPLFGIGEGDVGPIARAVSCHQDIAADGAFAVAMLARFAPTLHDEGAAAYRRLHWEAGHVGQLLYLEAEAHDIGATGMGCFFDDAIHELLGLTDRTFQSIYSFTVGGAVHDPRIASLAAYHHRPIPTE